MLGAEDDPEAPVMIDEAVQDGVAELYHWINRELKPVYMTVAVSDEADCPTSYEKGPAGATLTVGSETTVTVTVAMASLASESVTSRQ